LIALIKKHNVTKNDLLSLIVEKINYNMWLNYV
jgi:hypothetical protein